VIQRLLLDGIDAEPAGTAVTREHDLTIPGGAYVAEAGLALPQLAGTGADVTLDSAVREWM
jgi:hypothetical protein